MLILFVDLAQELFILLGGIPAAVLLIVLFLPHNHPLTPAKSCPQCLFLNVLRDREIFGFALVISAWAIGLAALILVITNVILY